jgi:hypothetical protein
MMSDDARKISESHFDWVAFFLSALIASFLSIVATGYMIGVRNDIYYLPIVEALYDDPQFSSDAFIQSLRYFSSGLWILLSGIAKHTSIYWLLFCLNFLSRFLAFSGLLACANLLGIRGRREVVLLAALLCATSLLRGQSLAGDGGLFINYFSHSEIANGLTLLILFLLIRGWLVLALAANGLVFFLNAFIGVWDAAMVAAVTLAMVLKSEISWREVWLKGSIGTLLAALLTAPVIHNILTNPDFGTRINFDYVVYLQEFWPYHFIFSDIPTHEKISLALLIALGVVAFIALGRQARPFLVAIGVFVAIYVVGIIVPYVTHNALILNLHLLRVSTMLQFLVVLGPLALATKWWFSASGVHKFLSAVLILLLCTPVRMTTAQPALNATVALLVVAVAFCPGIRARIPELLLDRRLPAVTLALVAIGFLASAANSAIRNASAQAWIDEWTTIGNWARSNTRPNDLFLLPTWNFRQASVRIQPGSEEDNAVIGSDIFESIALRSVWTDFRNGAAVLWSPSYYGQWHQRITEISSLRSLAEQMEYAKANGVSYVIDLCQHDPVQRKAFSTDRLCVYAAS